MAGESVGVASILPVQHCQVMSAMPDWPTPAPQRVWIAWLIHKTTEEDLSIIQCSHSVAQGMAPDLSILHTLRCKFFNNRRRQVLSHCFQELLRVQTWASFWKLNAPVAMVRAKCPVVHGHVCRIHGGLYCQKKVRNSREENKPWPHTIRTKRRPVPTFNQHLKDTWSAKLAAQMRHPPCAALDGFSCIRFPHCHGPAPRWNHPRWHCLRCTPGLLEESKGNREQHIGVNPIGQSIQV